MSVRRRPPSSAPLAYLFVGEDSYLRTHHRDEVIAAHVASEGRAFGVATFSLDRTPLAEVLAQSALRPMLSARQVLVVSGLEALGDQEVELLEKYFESPADFTVLVFEANKLDRRTRLARLLLEECKVTAAEWPAEDAARGAVKQFAQELGLQLDPAAAEEFLSALGPDHGRLRMELEKLRTYVGADRQAMAADVAAVVSEARKFTVFELADLLAERRRAEAVTRLRQLLEAGESPVGIVGLLGWLYRQLLQAQALPPSTPVWKAAQVLRAPRTRIGPLLHQARKFTPAELRAAFPALLEADVRLKSSSPNPAAVLEVLVTQLTALQGEEETVGREAG
ncbi:MAG: DNA polymerase III subunit delta [Terriglobia bacterium]